MRTRLLLTAALLLPTSSAAALLAPAPVAEACGPYGEVRHELIGRIVSERPASEGLEVRALCGDEVYEAAVGEDGSFGFASLPGRSCVIEATARECYTWDRSVTVAVSLPSEALTIVIPSEDR